MPPYPLRLMSDRKGSWFTGVRFPPGVLVFKGDVAKRLGNGLQLRQRGFDSHRHLL